MSRIENKRKNEILGAAKKIFTEKGYNNTTMEDIVAETNLSKGGVYYYFKNKEDLCLNLLYSETVKYHNISSNVDDFGQDIDPIKNVCRYFLNFLINDVEEVAILSSIYIETRHDLAFRKKISEKFDGHNVDNILRYVNEHSFVENQSFLRKKTVYFMDIFHSMLYYKYIEDVNYVEQKDDIEDMFLSIFKDVKRDPIS